MVLRLTFVLVLLAMVVLSTNAFADVAVIGVRSVEVANRTDNFVGNLTAGGEPSLVSFNNFGRSLSIMPYADFSRTFSENSRNNGEVGTPGAFPTGSKFGGIIQLYRPERDSLTSAELFGKKPHKQATAVPEPTSLLLWGSVLMPLAWRKRRR